MNTDKIKISPAASAGFYYNEAEMWVVYGIVEIEDKFYFSLIAIDNSFYHMYSGKKGGMSGSFMKKFNNSLSALLLFMEINDFAKKAGIYGSPDLKSCLEEYPDDLYRELEEFCRLREDGIPVDGVFTEGNFIEPLKKILQKE